MVDHDDHSADNEATRLKTAKSPDTAALHGEATQVMPSKNPTARVANDNTDAAARAFASAETVVASNTSAQAATKQAPAKTTARDATKVAGRSHAQPARPPGSTDTLLIPDEPDTKIERMERTPRPLNGVHREIDVGSVIRDRFVLKKVIGKGGMGAVYRALDLVKHDAGDDQPYVAVKLLSGDFKDHPHAFVTLQREAKKTQELAHPNIVTVYDFDREEDLVYLTMEELSGHPLIDVIKGKTDKVLSYKEALDIIEQIARGLAYAHSKGIVHSDLKPANLFLTNDGVIKILDFGIARAANQKLYQDNFDAGQLGALTLSYASPEMIRFEAPHPSDDIYALGIIICELLGSAHPFDRTDAKTAAEKKLQPKLPEIKNPFLKKCLVQTLSLERATRIEDANEFLKKFNSAISAPRRLLAIGTFVVLAALANFLYIQTIEVEAVPFKSLPQSEQQRFYQLIEEGNTALKFQDLQEAVVKFNSAWEIHDNNDEIDKARKTIARIVRNNLAEAGDDAARSFAEAQLLELKRYPAFKDIEVPD